jgi:hypothetical protein
MWRWRLLTTLGKVQAVERDNQDDPDRQSNPPIIYFHDFCFLTAVTLYQSGVTSFLSTRLCSPLRSPTYTRWQSVAFSRLSRARPLVERHGTGNASRIGDGEPATTTADRELIERQDDRGSSSQRGRSFNPWPLIEAA